MGLNITARELSARTGYSLSRIGNLRREGVWKKGIHYFQETKRIFTFDGDAIAIWQKGLGNGECVHEERDFVGECLSKFKKNKAVNKPTRHQREQKAS